MVDPASVVPLDEPEDELLLDDEELLLLDDDDDDEEEEEEELLVLLLPPLEEELLLEDVLLLVEDAPPLEEPLVEPVGPLDEPTPLLEDEEPPLESSPDEASAAPSSPPESKLASYPLPAEIFAESPGSAAHACAIAPATRATKDTALTRADIRIACISPRSPGRVNWPDHNTDPPAGKSLSLAKGTRLGKGDREAPAEVRQDF